LENVDISCIEDNSISVAITDGRGRKTITGKLYNRAYIEYRDYILQILENRKRAQGAIFDLCKMLNLLTTLKKMIGVVDEIPILIEFTEANDVVMQVIHPVTKQHIICIMHTYIVKEEDVLAYSFWELKFRKTVNNKKTIKIKKSL
jgi:hypothetical protein